MNALWWWALLAAGVGAVLFSDDPEQDMNAMELIRYWGYEGEQHDAKTADGWTLQLHRIPHGKNQKTVAGRPVVILQHGVECSSDNWLLNLPHQSAGFVFADAGFDVWLPNSRMNVYTSLQDHTRQDEEFWRNTYDDMIKYDLDAVFDYIGNATGQPHFYYVGHSQGTVIMFGKLAAEPGFARRVRAFFALGPAVTFAHMGGPFGVLCRSSALPVSLQLWQTLAWSRFGLLLLQPELVALLAKATCRLAVETEYCAAIFFLIGGPSTTTNQTRMPVYDTHIPADASTATVQHYCQQVNNGRFSYFHYPTAAENIAHYGSATDIPDYDISNIDAPIYLFSSPNDILTTEADLAYLYAHINNSVIVDHFHIDGFSHMDFLWSLNATDRVYNPIIDIINADLEED